MSRKFSETEKEEGSRRTSGGKLIKVVHEDTGQSRKGHRSRGQGKNGKDESVRGT